MWLGIIALADKIFQAILFSLGWLKETTDAKTKVRKEQQAKMDEAEAKGDFDAWKKARSRRNRA